jgi:uncharacterized protein with NRDE domain
LRCVLARFEYEAQASAGPYNNHMCLLALLHRVVEDCPLIVGANREELYNRGGQPPQILDGPIRAIGGRDPAAGGTWLAVNASGVLIAVTNRPKSQLPSEPRSRGLLARDLLTCPTAKAAAEMASKELSFERFAGCNVVCADGESAIVLQASDWLRVRPLPPGIHVLTNGDVNDASDRRLGHALWWLHQRNYNCAADAIAALKELCGQRGNGDPPICIRKDDRGTVSSSIIASRQPLERSAYWHAQGPPDTTPYVDCSELLQQIAPSEVR